MKKYLFVILFLGACLSAKAQEVSDLIFKDGNYPKMLSLDQDTIYIFSQPQTWLIYKHLEERLLLIEEIETYYSADSVMSMIDRDQTNVIKSQQETISILTGLNNLNETSNAAFLEAFNASSSEIQRLNTGIESLQQALEREKRRKRFWRRTSFVGGTAALVAGIILLQK